MEEQIKNHTYYKIMTNLNTTDCYLVMLWQGNKQIEDLMIPYICKMRADDPSIPKFCNSREDYFKIREDFRKNFPGVIESFWEEKRGDCIIS